MNLRLVLLLAAGLVLAPTAPAAAAAEADVPAAKVERLADAISQMVPLGVILESVAVQDPHWPLGEGADVGQLACVRGELSVAGYRRYNLPRAQAYASRNAARLDADLALLEGGAAALFSQLTLAGAEAEAAGVEADPQVVLSGATPEQLENFMSLFSDPANAGLRELGGIGESLGLEGTKEEMETAGEEVGFDLASRFMRRAMVTCEVDPALLP